MTEVAKMFYTVEDMTQTYSFCDSDRVREYVYSLLSYPVPDAMRGLSNFYVSQKCGNHVFAVNEFIKKYHNFTFAIYAKEDAAKDIDCIINQMVAIHRDTIYDVGAAIKYKNEYIYTQFCRIPLLDYPENHLVPGESLIQLPNPFNSRDISFYDYLMKRPGAKVLCNRPAI